MGNSDLLTSHNLVTSSFGYSGAELTTLDASDRYTIVTIGVDESGSVSAYKALMEKCIQEIVGACQLSPLVDNLLLRLVAFSSSMREIHGFKQLINCHESDYDDCLYTGGSTMLFGTAQNIIEATGDYGKQLVQTDFIANGIIFLITDGDDNASRSVTAADVGEALKKIWKEEVTLESLLTILVGIGAKNDQILNDYLSNFKKDAGLSQYVDIDDANKSTLAKLSNFVSKSISNQSKSLGSGNASVPLQF